MTAAEAHDKLVALVAAYGITVEAMHELDEAEASRMLWLLVAEIGVDAVVEMREALDTAIPEWQRHQRARDVIIRRRARSN